MTATQLLPLLTLQIVEGRMTVENARAIVIAKAVACRERRRESNRLSMQRHRHNGLLTRQVEIAKAMAAGAH